MYAFSFYGEGGKGLFYFTYVKFQFKQVCFSLYYSLRSNANHVDSDYTLRSGSNLVYTVCLGHYMYKNMTNLCFRGADSMRYQANHFFVSFFFFLFFLPPRKANIFENTQNAQIQIILRIQIIFSGSVIVIVNTVQYWMILN